jgi:hypothetical protein
MSSVAGRNLVALALMLLLASVVGCGGGGAGSTTGGNDKGTETPHWPTKAQLAEKLGDVCQEHTDRQVVAREAWQKKNGFPPAEDASRAQLEKELVVVILPIVRDTIHDVGQLHVGKLRPSPQQKKQLEEFRKALEHGVRASKKDPSWVATNAGEPFAEARTLSSELGTPLCGQA